MKKILFSIMAAMSVMPSMAQSKTATTRDERNYIVEGNKLYNEQRYADAEVAYRKALQENAMNEIAQFNLAASLLRQRLHRAVRLRHGDRLGLPGGEGLRIPHGRPDEVQSVV